MRTAEIFYPHFVREMMIRDHVMFNFHEECGAIHDYVARVFARKIIGIQRVG